MSAYVVARICQRVRKDEAFAAQLKLDPAATLGDFSLTADERTALLEGDVAWLHDHGVHGLLLGALARAGLFGLSIPIYLERIQRARLPP
jgi:hypothetical protein